MAVKDTKIDRRAQVAKKSERFFLTPAVSQTNRPFAVIRPGTRFRIERAAVSAFDETGAVTADLRIMGQDGLISAVTWAVNGTPEDFDTGAFVGREGGVVFMKAAATGQSFTAAHVVTAAKYGCILIQSTDAGVISTKVVSATQAYDSAALAIAALPAPTAGNIALGYLVIHAGVADWDANTDDLTDGSDLVTCVYVPQAVATRSPLTGAMAFADGSYVEGALSGTLTDLKGDADEDIVLIYTSDGTGALVNGAVEVGWRPRPLQGEAD